MSLVYVVATTSYRIFAKVDVIVAAVIGLVIISHMFRIITLHVLRDIQVLEWYVFHLPSQLPDSRGAVAVWIDPLHLSHQPLHAIL